MQRVALAFIQVSYPVKLKLLGKRLDRTGFPCQLHIWDNRRKNLEH
jgi:hypothetical protein